jgi:hypothetical protein
VFDYLKQLFDFVAAAAAGEEGAESTKCADLREHDLGTCWSKRCIESYGVSLTAGPSGGFKGRESSVRPHLRFVKARMTVEND